MRLFPKLRAHAGLLLAHYYAAYAHIALSYQQTDATQRDLLLDQAEASLVKATELRPSQTDGLFVLWAYLSAARLAVNSQERWQQYGAACRHPLCPPTGGGHHQTRLGKSRKRTLA